jgi:hypothetical protein
MATPMNRMPGRVRSPGIRSGSQLSRTLANPTPNTMGSATPTKESRVARGSLWRRILGLISRPTMNMNSTRPNWANKLI